MQEMQIRSLGWDDPMEKEMETHPVFLRGKSHGQKSPMGCSLQTCKESDMTKATQLGEIAPFYKEDKP